MTRIDTLADIFDSKNHTMANIWRDRQETWFIPDTYLDMQHIYHKGYSAGVSKIQEGLNLHIGYSETEYHDIAGSEIDISDYIHGAPDYFIEKTVKDIGTPKEVKLQFYIHIVASDNPDTFAKNAGTLLGIIDDIERTGNIKFTLSALYDGVVWNECSSAPKQALFHEILLNKNILSDIAIISHPSFARRILYSFHSNILGWKEKNGRRFEYPERVVKDIPPTRYAIGNEIMFKDYWSQLERETALKAALKKVIDNQLSA